MGDPDVRTLLDAVRHHLWREQGRVAVRRAAWLSAATMLLAGALHLAALSLPVGGVLWVVGIEWAVSGVMVAWRRPADGDCALWIDRHLGGASAFTTLLEPASNTPTPAHVQAVRWLERWAAAKVPGVLRSLGEQRTSVPVARSLLAMAVCGMLALFVLTLADTAATALRPARPSAGAASNDTATAAARTPVAAQLAGEIANALRSTGSPGEREGQRGGDAPTGGPMRADDGSRSTDAASRVAPLSADAAPGPDTRSSATLDAGASAGPGRSADAASGRDAGDSPDSRADAGASRAAPGTIAAIRSGSTLRFAGGERQADMEQAGGFDETLSLREGAKPGAMVRGAAATPPPAVAEVRMGLAETSYLQAWMKATGRSR
ncbi:MAG: hypothetical protein ABI520_01595 [Caldimonas sp.]